ncbi:MAG TPA: hypothetical protein VM935_13670 [Chitinophagaceae bacterium]|nr:hypothetical protein [Chitinophagaceae bacterium]
MDTITQSLITLVIGGFFGGVIKSLLDYRSQVFSHLWEKRMTAYSGIWKLMKEFPLWPRVNNVTYSTLYGMSHAMKEWYFDSGGILMSEKTRNAYGNLQEEINANILAGKKPEDFVDPLEYNRIQKLCSGVRTEMTRDLLSRKKLI